MEGYLLSKLVDPFLSKLANYALSDEHTSIFRSLENHLNLLCARSSDFMVQIKRAEQSGTKKRKREVVCWLEQVQSIAKEIDALINDIQTRGFVRKFFSEGQATKLDARVSELLEKSPVSDKLVLDDHEVQGHLLPTKGLVGVGFKENFEKIWKMLVIEKVKCIGIHGMGGVGKTTLAKHINNRLVEEKQHHVVWITISEQFSVPKLQDEMARDLGIDDMSNLCDEDKRSSRLNTVLSKLKNVVLIFDDVWERIDLMKLGDPFSIEGCRLVITTRSKQVCCQIGCSKTIDVKRLQENEAWELFKQIQGLDLNLTSEVEIIAKSTVKKCRGLPLGIITLAGSMKGETASHAWSNVLAELEESVMGQHEMGTYVFKVLKLSFDRLCLREKKRNGYSKSQLCFLHCSTYPEDYKIREEELIQRFIVEGYLERKESRKALLNEGRSILDSLVSACLLERGKSLFEYGVDFLTMHDLLRGMALEVSEGKTKVFDGVKSSLEDISKEEIWTGNIEKIFLWNVASGIISEMEPPNCPNLSTLSLNRDSSAPPKSPWSLSHSFFSQMQCLSTLDVSGSGIEGLPESLLEVVSLKTLLCESCPNLRYMPNLGKLKKLEELDLSRTGIEEVPGGIEELINLKFLSLVGANCMKPSGLVLNCTNIQYLLLPTHIKLLKVEEVVGLKHVEKFVGRLEEMGEFIELIRNRPELDYTIHVAHQSYTPSVFFGGHGNHLILSGYDFKKAKDEEQVVISETKISCLSLSKCEWQRKSISEDISRLCDVASLVRLDVVNDEEAEWVIWRREEYVDTSISSSPLPIFSSLTILYIMLCNKVKKLGLLPSQFPSLKELLISDCSEIEEIIMEVGEETRDNGINNVFLPNLKTLALEFLPRLKSICNATMVCTSIREVYLWDCPELKKLALIFGEEDDSPPPNDFNINLSSGSEEWWEALELGHPTHRHLLKPIFC